MQSRKSSRIGDYAPNSSTSSGSTPRRRQQGAEERRTDSGDPQEGAEPDVGDEGVPEEQPRKHIHPCVCDIDKRRMAAIREHLRQKRIAQQKYETRVRQLEEELRLAEEAELMRLRLLEEEKELYGDEYEQEGMQKKRKKRSARRASMVSLGVRQIINWKKPPKIAVKYTRTTTVRKINPTYCRPVVTPRPSPRPPINWGDLPKIPIRTTRTVSLRSLEVQKKLAYFQKQQRIIKYPNRPPFTFTAYL